MEKREDLKSILPYLPLIIRSSSLFWPSKAQDSLKALASGPHLSKVYSGNILFDFIEDLRDSIGISDQPLAWTAADGYSLFFDELLSRMDSLMWFGEVIPALANLLLRLPSLLETHYHSSDETFGEGKAGLRTMCQQEPGVVILSQELIAGLLACAFFCLFPASTRGENNLPTINFDYLFSSLHPNARPSQEQKLKCLVHYFERISVCMPTGFVSFERKVLQFEQISYQISYPKANFWRESTISLCPFEVFCSGLIEDQKHDALEVDFANEYLGGGALHRGCVQEEIRFMINPELIVGMLFMASMKKNDAIEIVGVERFSSYMGYGSSFRFVGDYLDKKPLDSIGRRKTRIIAIDALSNPGIRQYGVGCLVRETNKAYCGFFDCSKYECYLKNIQEVQANTSAQAESSDIFQPCMDNTANSSASSLHGLKESYQESVGIATGNWGCGAFGGDPEIKCIIQWLAASQALRPFIHYYTFGEAALQRLEQVSQWILLNGWTVGDLWNMLAEYSSQRLNGETNLGFFIWLLPEQDHSSDLQDMSE